MTYFSNKKKSSPVPGYPLALAAQQLLIRPRNALFRLCLEKIIFPKADSGKRKGEGLGGTRAVAEPSLHEVQRQHGLWGDQLSVQPITLRPLSKEEPSSATEKPPLKCKGGSY